MEADVVKIPTEIFNPTYLPVLDVRARYLVMCGGAGAGKSVFAAQKILFKDLLCGKKERILLVRKVHRTIRHSQFQLMVDLISQYGLNSMFDIRKSVLEIDCHNGNSLICVGVDDPEKIKSIQGITKIWIEEATELRYEDYKQLDLRMRGSDEIRYQMILTLNPIDEYHWINKEFYKRKKPNSCVINTTYKDNLFIDNAYKRVLESIDDENLRRVYVLGQWGVLKDLIYEPFETISSYPQMNEFDEIIYGLDFGYNNPSCLIRVGIKDKVFYVQELFYKTKLLTEDIIFLLRRFGVSQNDYVYADHDLAKIAEIRKAGFNIQKAEKDVKNGIDAVKSAKILSYVGNANLHKERQSYKYKENKNGELLEEPVKFNDHALDALRYAIYSYSRRPRIGIIGYKDMLRLAKAGQS